MTSIYIVRHAQAEGNVYRFCQGQYDGLLSAKGEKQLEYIAKRFKDIALDAVYSSDLYRAAMTARAIANGRQVCFTKELRELNFGELECMPWGYINRKYPDLCEKFNAKTCDISIPGGESIMQAGKRMRAEIYKIAALYDGGTVAVASHGTAIASLFALIENEEMDDFSMYNYFGNTSVSLIRVYDGKIEIVFQNDMSHLCDMKKVSAEFPARTNPNVTPLNTRFGFDLWFRCADYLSDCHRIQSYGIDSWETIYGEREDMNVERFMDNVRGMMSADSESVYFAMHGDTPMGLLMLDTRQRDEKNVGHIAFVYLVEEYRYMGLGAQLIGQAVFLYRKKGRSILRLNVARSNKVAIGLYTKLGFAPSNSIRSTFSNQMVMKKDIMLRHIADL